MDHPRKEVRATISELIRVPVAGGALTGELEAPTRARALVLFAHGSGSSRHSPRNRMVAAELRTARLGTVLIDLLTDSEGREDLATGAHRFDIELLGRRVTAVVDWLTAEPDLSGLPLVLFGASTGAAAALVAAAERPDRVLTVVSRGGRPDLAQAALSRVRAPVLLVVGGRDPQVLRLNEQAARWLRVPHALRVVPDATHLFEEPGALEEVVAATKEWCDDRLRVLRGERGRHAVP
ncbi:dienelactone hydrolase family protein [Streptomyces sp. NPDC002134]|uniref:dienelactone hydrolase family protein n=1 Tax=Streptomyces sp. NPDC002134 TaxID=3364632 RepID=UPI0036A451F1